MAKRQTRGQFHGYVVIDKPAGMTSHDVVGRVRRIVGEKRVGHAGTLDPAATGVLPIAIGLATRTVEFLSDADKTYVAEITFGVETDSADGDGVVTHIRDASAVDVDGVESVLDLFRGPQLQVPPMHSAIKVDGVAMYELARKGETVDLPARSITIHQLELLGWEPPVATLLVACSKGTYIRSLARDLGNALGVGAYMSNLVRVQTGPFVLEDATTLDEFARDVSDLPWEAVAWHPDTVLAHRPAVIVDADGSRSWQNGNPIQVAGEGVVRVYDERGHWLGVGEAAEHVRPLKVVVERADNE